MEWLKNHGEISEPSFSLNEPKVMAEVPRTRVAATTDAIPPLEKVEIMMEYR